MSDAKPSSASVSTSQGPALHVPARFIPVPKTISPEAQAVLTQPNPYGGESEPDPSDKAAWEKLSREGNEAFTRMLASRFASDQPKIRFARERSR